MYQDKELYTLDFTNLQYYLEFHEIIRDELDFPDYYGMNWDAMWDCLTDMVGEPLHIEIIGLDVLEQKFGDTAQKLIDILRELKDYNHGRYAHQISVTLVQGGSKTKIL